MTKQTGQSTAGWHRVELFMRCPQLFAYRELLHLRQPGERIETARGTVLHEMLRAWYMGLGHEGALLTARAMPERYKFAVEPTLLLFDCYIRHYPREPFEVLDVEKEIVVDLGDHVFTRRIDLIALFTDQKVYAIDHKTAGRPGARARTAAMDWSLMTQQMVLAPQCWALYGHQYGGFVLNLIGTQDQEFRRQPVLFSPQVLARAPAGIHFYLEQIAALAGRNPWEYPRSGACVGRWGPCDYVDLCDYGQAAASAFEVVSDE